MTRAFSLRLLRSLARLMVGALLLAQALVAAHACTLAANAPAPAPQHNVAGHGAAHCHEAAATEAPLAGAGGELCLKHCDHDNSPASSAAAQPAPMPALAVLHVPALAPAALMAANGIAAAHEQAPATDPPPAILFHAFRS